MKFSIFGPGRIMLARQAYLRGYSGHGPMLQDKSITKFKYVGLLPKTDPELFRTYFPPRRTPASVAIQTLDDETGLLSEFEEQRNVRLQGNAKEASAFRKWILRSQLNAVDAGLIMAFPRAYLIRRQDHGVSIDLVLEERVEA